MLSCFTPSAWRLDSRHATSGTREFHLTLQQTDSSEDHVWTEFWSPTAGHWVHVDSCEAEVGKPQLYDRGWGKKQAYCLAFGPYGAEDVTRAYVDDWGECLQRRAEKRFGTDGQPTGERDLARVSRTSSTCHPRVIVCAHPSSGSRDIHCPTAPEHERRGEGTSFEYGRGAGEVDRR